MFLDRWSFEEIQMCIKTRVSGQVGFLLELLGWSTAEGKIVNTHIQMRIKTRVSGHMEFSRNNGVERLEKCQFTDSRVY